ncbi:putative lipid II flippase FtsW [Ornithinibacillus halophilus]|uniref:Probable peptidoglycan glycosyltransferase FtsW n=1 Tax=Ornithinibacillus halophilus TaxID=930117 RepID=A0A1M5C1Q9_9BACI|nr:putative lipid II flippase FtsW [Ornithinibacillus halophilus]SHF48596.1 cell division-specific peptidoglycan biosynthesis regulator FtsW [Ornithinibacillus halophilus]
MKKNIKYFDFTLVIIPILLAGFGVVMIYSASMVIAIVEGLESTHYFYRQLMWFFLGLIGFVFFSFFSYRNYQRLIKIVMLGVFALLLGVIFFGNEVNNAKSWLSFGPIGIQPAEFAKLGLIIYLSAIYSKKQSYINDFNRGVLPPLIMTGLVLGLVVMQPDIGTASIIFLIACSVIFSSGIKFKHLFILVFIGLLLLAIAVPSMVTDERIERFTGAYQPFEAPDDDGYHLIQSYLAIGVGGLTGEGLGQSVQKLGYLYAPHNDFIMAVIAEELGFIGVVIVIGMLAIIVLRGLYISWRCKDSFGALLAIGISSMVGLQAFINLGAISGILPITGVTLPFVSYGGSSLLVLMASMGILNNIAMNVKRQERQPVQVNEDDEPIPNSFRHRGGEPWTS